MKKKKKKKMMTSRRKAEEKGEEKDVEDEEDIRIRGRNRRNRERGYQKIQQSFGRKLGRIFRGLF